MEILAITAVQGALIAALAFLARSIVVHWLGKDLELHKSRLSADAQVAVEAFKGELSREALEHQVRFQSLNGNQVAAIEALYVKLVETRYTMEAFVSAWRANIKKSSEESERGSLSYGRSWINGAFT